MDRKYAREVLALVPGFLLSVASILFGEPLLREIGVDPANRPLLVVATAFLLMLGTCFLAIHFLHSSSLATFETKLQQLSGAFKSFDGDHALAYLASRAGQARVIRNTMIMYGADTYSLATQSLDAWRTAKRNAIDKGVHVFDVISEGDKDRTAALAAEFPLSNLKGKYEAFIVDCSLGALINFTVLEYADNEPSEVLFGWVASATHGGGFAGPCFQTYDSKVVSLFDAWFAELVRKATPVES